MAKSAKNYMRKKKQRLPIKMVTPKEIFKEAEKPVGWTKKIIKREKQKLF